MAFETNKEAAEWKAAIEAQIRYVAETRRPMLPDSVDAKTISAILDLGQSGCVWKRVAVYEGVCVLEHITFEKRSQGRYKYHPLMNMQVCLCSFFFSIFGCPCSAFGYLLCSAVQSSGYYLCLLYRTFHLNLLLFIIFLLYLQDQSPFYLFWQRLVMDPEYMKVCIEQQQSDGYCPTGSGGSSGAGANRVRKAQLSVCCR